jgi:hypothetical protein
VATRIINAMKVVYDRDQQAAGLIEWGVTGIGGIGCNPAILSLFIVG